MARRSLSADEAALWRRVMATVKPLRAVAANVDAPPAAPAPSAPAKPASKPRTIGVAIPTKREPVAPPRTRTLSGSTLDGGWDRRLVKGAVSPDDVIDLHGHTLASAHAMLDARLGQAIARGDRVVLLVTGKPPRPESERPHARGAIRSAVADWLAASRHAGRIAAVRGAHPRHGGAGALYLIIRRARG